MVGVFVVLLMMVLLVVGCTVEVVDSDKVVEAVSTDEENINVSNLDIIDEVGTNKVGILVGRGIIDEVVGINGTEIIDEVVNTVDVSDTDDIRTEDVESLVILIPVITAGGLVVQLSKVTNSHA